jgi:hypothetical protein
LELRDQGSINSILHAQIDVSMIQSIDQSGPAIDTSDALGNAYFVITLHPDADLLNAKGVAGAVPWKVFHTGPGCVLQLYIIAGCSLWKRQEASNFFAELRIMVHFLGGGGGPSRPASRQVSPSPHAVASHTVASHNPVPSRGNSPQHVRASVVFGAQASFSMQDRPHDASEGLAYSSFTAQVTHTSSLQTDSF